MAWELQAEPTPLYWRLRETLRERIRRGEFAPGARLPTEEELCRQYGVSRITASRAVRDLAAEGLVVRRQGRGTFVAAPVVQHDLVRLTDFVEDMQQAGLQAESRVLAQEQVAAPAHVAEALGLSAGAPVTELWRLRLGDGAPLAVDVTWLPPPIAALLEGEDLAHQTIYGILERRHGLRIERGEYLIEAVAAAGRVAEALAVPQGAPLLRFHRTSWAATGQPVYHQERYYHGERVRYRLTLERRGRPLAEAASTIRTFEPVFER
jgi:GntR family transcriptional regulator